MIRRLKAPPVLQPRLDFAQRMSFEAGRLEEFRDHLVKTEVLVKRLIGCAPADVNAAAFTKLYPARPVQLAISSADSVRMDAKAAGQFACAGELLSNF